MWVVIYLGDTTLFRHVVYVRGVLGGGSLALVVESVVF